MCHSGSTTPDDLVRLRRARDRMDRDFAEPLDVPQLARESLMSVGHFQRSFKEAFGVDAVQIGTGGSIPIVAEFAELNPDAVFLLTAVVDPTSRMHGIDESLDLADLHKATLAEALLLQNLAR